MTHRKSQTKKLTKEQATAVKNFRKMWNWIADETEKRKVKVLKEDYFKANKITDIPRNLCYLCEMCNAVCSRCAVDWGEDRDILFCDDNYSSYDKWVLATSWEYSARLAREIANLPLKEGMKG